MGWEGVDCGAGLGMGGQHWPVPNLGVGLQVMGRELGGDEARESWAEVYVVGGWGKPGQGQSRVDGLGQRTSQLTKEPRGQKIDGRREWGRGGWGWHKPAGGLHEGEGAP